MKDHETSPSNFPSDPAACQQLAGLGNWGGSGPLLATCMWLRMQRLTCLPSSCGMPQARPCQCELMACGGHKAGAWDAFHSGSENTTYHNPCSLLAVVVPPLLQPPTHGAPEPPKWHKYVAKRRLVNETPLRVSSLLCYIFQSVFKLMHI